MLERTFTDTSFDFAQCNSNANKRYRIDLPATVRPYGGLLFAGSSGPGPL